MDINKPGCVHYWICGEPVNGSVQAVCRYCGEVKSWQKKEPLFAGDMQPHIHSFDDEHQDESEDAILL